jgi:Tol biopolymer transport system component
MRMFATSRRLATALLLFAAFASAAAAQGRTERVSVDSNGRERPDGGSGVCRLSADGEVALFVTGWWSYSMDVWCHDRRSGATECVSVDLNGMASGDSFGAALAADGDCIVFCSGSGSLVAGDTNGSCDIFVRTRSLGVTERVSVDSSGGEGNSDSGGLYRGDPAISADGSVVAFTSDASNLVPGDFNRNYDVFVHDRRSGATECVSLAWTGGFANGVSGLWDGPAISADGRFVAFESRADNLVRDDTNSANDVFVRDRRLGTTERVSVSSSGLEADRDCYRPCISADGRFVAFTSDATNLIDGDRNGQTDVFVHDRRTGLTERVSVDLNGDEVNGPSYSTGNGALSADGRIVVFETFMSDFESNASSADRVYARDRATGRTMCASVSSRGEPARDSAELATVSGDGEVVAFESDSDDLVSFDRNQAMDCFVHEFCWTTASWSNYGDGLPGTYGVPAFTSRANPVLGSTLALDVANSSGRFTVGALFIGLERASIPSSFGGLLLVQPLTTLLIGLAPPGATLVGTIPDDHLACGATIELQVFEADPGAVKGVSFTPGLELVLGN